MRKIEISSRFFELRVEREKKFSLDFMFSKKKLSYKIAATNVC